MCEMKFRGLIKWNPTDYRYMFVSVHRFKYISFLHVT